MQLERRGGHLAHQRCAPPFSRFDYKEAPAMAGADRIAVEDVVRKVLVDEHADVLREPLRWSVARLMEVEVCEVIGAEHGQRTPDRAAHRNG
jgi:hypothetical protein